MKKKAVSILKLPVRLGKALVRLGKALPSRLGRLRNVKGKPRIALFAGLAVVVVLAVLVLRPGQDDNEVVADTLERYAEATRGKDYQVLCDELLSKSLVDRIKGAGLPCEVALRTGLEDRQNPTLTVQAVEVNGDQALAKVRSSAVGEVPSVDTVRLVHDGDGWRIASLAGPAAGTP